MKSRGRRGPRGSGKFSTPCTTGDTSALYAQNKRCHNWRYVCMDWAASKRCRNHTHSSCNHNRQVIACTVADAMVCVIATHTANSCWADVCMRALFKVAQHQSRSASLYISSFFLGRCAVRVISHLQGERKRRASSIWSSTCVQLPPLSPFWPCPRPCHAPAGPSCCTDPHDCLAATFTAFAPRTATDCCCCCCCWALC